MENKNKQCCNKCFRYEDNSCFDMNCDCHFQIDERNKKVTDFTKRAIPAEEKPQEEWKNKFRKKFGIHHEEQV